MARSAHHAGYQGEKYLQIRRFQSSVLALWFRCQVRARAGERRNNLARGGNTKSSTSLRPEAVNAAAILRESRVGGSADLGQNPAGSPPSRGLIALCRWQGGEGILPPAPRLRNAPVVGPRGPKSSGRADSGLRRLVRSETGDLGEGRTEQGAQACKYSAETVPYLRDNAAALWRWVGTG